MRTRTRVFIFPYALARVPLTVVDRSIMQKLPPGALVRTVFDHGLGTADHWAGLIMAEPRIVDSGRTRIDVAGRFTGLPTDDSPRLPDTTLKSYAKIRPANGPDITLRR